MHHNYEIFTAFNFLINLVSDLLNVILAQPSRATVLKQWYSAVLSMLADIRNTTNTTDQILVENSFQ